MDPRESWRAAANPYLHAGELIQAVIPAQASFPHPVMIATVYGMLRHTARLVVATNERILIFRRTSTGALGDFVEERGRDIEIGPPRAKFVFYHTNRLGERLYIHRRWFKDVRVADSARTA